MNVLLIGAIVASFLVVIAAVTLAVRSQGDIVRRWLALFLIFGALWSLIVNLQSPIASSVYNLWVVRLTFVAAILMVYCMLRFALSVAGRRIKPWLSLAMGFTTFLLLLATLIGLVIPSVEVTGNVVAPHRLPGYFIVAVFILAVATWSIALLWVTQRSIREVIVKTRLKIVMTGLSSGIIVGLFTNMLLPNIVGSILPARYGWIAITLWTVILMYAVVRHKFLDIRLAAVRTVAYFMALATMIGVYFSIAFVASAFLKNSLANITEIVVNLSTALFLALLFQPMKRYFDRLTNKIFYRDNYSTDEFFASLSRELGATTDLRHLLQRAATEIGNTMKSEFSHFYVQYGSKQEHMNAGTNQRGHVPLKDIRILDEYVISHGASVVLVEDVRGETELYRILTEHKIALVLPLLKDERILGYLFLGHQRSRAYMGRDIRALETISDELVIAIQNALSVQEVKDINATLQQRINEATKELRETNKQLQKLDEAKDEFVSMASHQLRTPLTSVKGYISMVLEGDAGKITNTQSKLLGEAFTSSERMVHLIGDFLNVSRLQTGKFLLEQRPIDLAKVVGQEVESLKTTAHAHNLKLQYRAPAYFPILYLDEQKIRQVLMNFMDNAIYYSQEDTTIAIKLAVEDGEVVLRVKDTGIGVPKAEQAHLFTKFFRATNARKQRPDGTGVGLFLAKKVIVAHGGAMVFESTEGEGSTFGFRLPVKKLSTAPAEDTEKLDK